MPSLYVVATTLILLLSTIFPALFLWASASLQYFMIRHLTDAHVMALCQHALLLLPYVALV